MRCNWSKTASNIFQSITQRQFGKHCLRVSNHGAWHTLTDLNAVHARGRTFSVSALWRSGVTHALQVEQEPQPPPQTLPLTKAQMSRAACQAVRISIQNGALQDAYFVVNSLRYSALRNDLRGFKKMPGLRQSLADFEVGAIHFDSDITPRLSSHALLHGLLRIGLTTKAFKLSKLMMESGIRLRSATLEAVMRGLVSPPLRSPLKQNGPAVHLFSGSEVLRLRPTMVQDCGARFAIQLLFLARKSRQRRTSRMFKILVAACIFNGEIIVASLLFGLLVRDWQSRMTLAARINPPTTTPLSETTYGDRDAQGRFDHPWTESLVPTRHLMQPVLSSINKALSNDGEGGDPAPSLQAALQALANLALLLDNHQIPFSQISSLIRSLYHCPKVDNKVWIVDKDGKPKCIQAYNYFHEVLERLIRTLPTKRPPTIAQHGIGHTWGRQPLGRVLPPPDLRACNALLHYALRHRLSPNLADMVLQNMTKDRHKPLNPDTVTYNILLRSGTLLRRPDITEHAVATLHSRLEKDQPGIVPIHNSHTSLAGSPSDNLLVSNTLPIEESLNVPIKGPIPDVDPFTLTAYVGYLISTGQSRATARLFRHLFPETRLQGPSSWNAMSDEGRMRLRWGHLTLQRAVVYGPHLLTVLLDGLRKAGNTTLAWRVWILAQRAQRKSLDPHFVPGVQPWCLPVHAYTIMMQCYGQEIKRIRRHATGYPLQTDTVGWQKLDRRPGRCIMGLKIGPSLYHRLQSGAQNIYHSLMELQSLNDPRGVKAKSRPDARFFNATLDIFGRSPFMRPRRARSSRSHWKRHLRLAQLTYAQNGTLPEAGHPLLQEVIENMVKTGFSVPAGFCHLVVGRLPSPSLEHGSKPIHFDHRPHAFPTPNTTFIPHCIPTTKERGLPIRRRRRLPFLHT